MKNIFISGTNRGIGLGLAKHFLKNPHNTVFCGMRDPLKNASELSAHKNAKIVSFDSTKKNTFLDFSNFLSDNKTKLDIIINNAGVNLVADKTTELKVRDMITMDTNLFGIINFLSLNLEKDLINKNAVIINVASQIGQLSMIRDADVKKRILNATTIDQVKAIANDFIEFGRNPEKPWCSKANPWPEYALTKLLLSVYSEILGKQVSIINNNIQVYSICPGWVKTELGGAKAPLTVEQAVQKFDTLIGLNDKINMENQGLFYIDSAFKKVRPI